jgi:dipeptidyl aminopeptidase/acylaminoacyl peptidase
MSALRLFLCLWVASVTAPALAATDVAAFGGLPSIEQASLSPDGSKIAFVKTTRDMRVLVLFDLNEDRLVRGVGIGDARLRSVEWADNDHLLLTTASSRMPYELSGERTEWNMMASYDLKTNKLTRLLRNIRGNETTMNTVYGDPVVQHKDGDTLVFVQGEYVKDGRTASALYRINLTTDTELLIKPGKPETDRWLVNDSGEVVAEQDYLERDRRWTIRLFLDGRPPQTASGVAPIDPPNLLGLSATGDAIIVALTQSDGVSLKPLSIKDGTWGPEMFSHQRLNDLVFENGSRRMLATAFIGDVTQYHFADRTLQDGWDWSVRTFGYQRVEFVSVSADHTKVIVKVMGGESGYAYYLVDMQEHLKRPIGKVYDGVSQIAEVRPIKYAAADGMEIPAYLTLPPGRPAKNLPVIVFPHGGPETHDNLTFDWWAQALATQGYAVLQPNYRGSNLSLKWVESGFGEWGRKMQTDLSDGLQYLIAQGVADPKRACIVGASYGGYAALAGVALQSNVYRCAVAVAGISDPADFMRWVKRKENVGEHIGLRYWERFLGVDDPGDKRLDAISPLRHADQVTVPLLLIHGRDDTTVPYDQSANIAKALKHAATPVEFVTLDREDHYLSRSATRLQMLQSSVEFLRKYNPPD